MNNETGEFCCNVRDLPYDEADWTDEDRENYEVNGDELEEDE